MTESFLIYNQQKANQIYFKRYILNPNWPKEIRAAKSLFYLIHINHVIIQISSTYI